MILSMACDLGARLDHLVVAGHDRVVLPTQVETDLDVEVLPQRGAEGGDLVGLGPDDQLRGHDDTVRPGVQQERRPFRDVEEAPAGVRQEGRAAGRHEVMRVCDGADGRIGDAGGRQHLAVVPERVLDRGGAGLAHADVQDQGLAGARRLGPRPGDVRHGREGPDPVEAAGQPAADTMGHALTKPAERRGVDIGGEGPVASRPGLRLGPGLRRSCGASLIVAPSHEASRCAGLGGRVWE